MVILSETPLWNEWMKEEYTIEDVKTALDIARKEGEMGWPSIEDVHDRMQKNRMESIGRFQLSESERECIEKALYFLHMGDDNDIT